MARPRVNQFAKDMGLNRNQAQRLINEGRRRKDGGSEILDSYSPELRQRMQRYEDAERIFTEDTRIGTMSDKKKKMKLPKSKKKMLDKMQQDKTDNPGTLYDAMEQADLEFDGVKAKDGKYMNCRGAGAAIQGTKFRGVS
jgi:hypothetical protein